jgi:hypothetical protein
VRRWINDGFQGGVERRREMNMSVEVDQMKEMTKLLMEQQGRIKAWVYC